MRLSRAHTLAAAALVAGLVAGCSTSATTPSGATTAPGGITASGVATSPALSPATTPSPNAPSASASGVQTNDSAPVTGSARPTAEAKDPSALPIPTAARTTPNLGSSKMIQPVSSIVSPPDSPVIKAGFSGAKVYLIQKKFGIDEQIQTLDGQTMSAVKRFQKQNGLDATGEVDQTTWKAMFPDVPWTIDHYQAKPSLPTTAGANARIEAMIAYMRSEKGAKYVWGSAGPKKYGYDCSGILLQAMYYAGLDPQPINVVDHQGDEYPTATKLYNYSGFKRVPVDERKRGDFIFYGPPGKITHVVLFLDDGYVLEAIPSLGLSEDHFYESWQNHGNTYSMKDYAIRVTE